MRNSTVIRVANELQKNGFSLVKNVIRGDDIERVKLAVTKTQNGDFSRQRRGDTIGIRNLLKAVPVVKQLAECATLLNLAQTLLGSNARPVKGILFDKTPAANWKVPWHQDLTIAVTERREIEGFGPWTEKSGITHVQPPLPILEGLFAIRIHLDDCGEDNGALKVLPGTHCLGRLSSNHIHELRRTIQEVTCSANAGDVLLLRPLLVHSSAPATQPSRRRVIHLEYSADDLPGGLAWHE